MQQLLRKNAGRAPQLADADSVAAAAVVPQPRNALHLVQAVCQAPSPFSFLQDLQKLKFVANASLAIPTQAGSDETTERGACVQSSASPMVWVALPACPHPSRMGSQAKFAAALYRTFSLCCAVSSRSKCPSKNCPQLLGKMVLLMAARQTRAEAISAIQPAWSTICSTSPTAQKTL